MTDPTPPGPFEGRTPGPWAVSRNIGPWRESNGRAHVTIECGSTAALEIVGKHAEANAPLIAAAPDLLAEVERLRGQEKALVESMGGPDNATVDDCIKAREQEKALAASGLASARNLRKKAEAQRAALVAALEKYGTHHPECNKSLAWHNPGKGLLEPAEGDDPEKFQPCDCGLGAALAQVKEAKS